MKADKLHLERIKIYMFSIPKVKLFYCKCQPSSIFTYIICASLASYNPPGFISPIGKEPYSDRRAIRKGESSIPSLCSAVN